MYLRELLIISMTNYDELLSATNFCHWCVHEDIQEECRGYAIE